MSTWDICPAEPWSMWDVSPAAPGPCGASASPEPCKEQATEELRRPWALISAELKPYIDWQKKRRLEQSHMADDREAKACNSTHTETHKD